jgi:hypothetical protein
MKYTIFIEFNVFNLIIFDYGNGCHKMNQWQDEYEYRVARLENWPKYPQKLAKKYSFFAFKT